MSPEALQEGADSPSAATVASVINIFPLLATNVSGVVSSSFIVVTMPVEAAVTSPFPFTVTLALVNAPTLELTVASVKAVLPVASPVCESCDILGVVPSVEVRPVPPATLVTVPAFVVYPESLFNSEMLSPLV